MKYEQAPVTDPSQTNAQEVPQEMVQAEVADWRAELSEQRADALRSYGRNALVNGGLVSMPDGTIATASELQHNITQKHDRSGAYGGGSRN